MAADQTLEFLKFGNFTCRCSLKGRYATFCQSLCRSVEPFWRFSHFTILQNGGHLGFLKLQNFTCQSSSEGQCASPCQIWCRSVKLLRIWPFFQFFQGGGRPPSCFTRVWTTQEEYLVVFVTVQNLLGIDAIVSIICKL